MNNNEKVITVAVVEDHDMMRNEVSRLIEHYGFQVIMQAENGKVALDKLAKSDQLPDVCLLDVRMPVMNGFETAKAIRLLYPTIKILAHSTGNNEENIIGMFQAGASGYLAKGGHPEKLDKAISEVHNIGYYFDVTIDNIILTYLRKQIKK